LDQDNHGVHAVEKITDRADLSEALLDAGTPPRYPGIDPLSEPHGSAGGLTYSHFDRAHIDQHTDETIYNPLPPTHKDSHLDYPHGDTPDT
jgi:hypothetical protein